MLKRLSRKLFAENLENRYLMAGDVSVTRSGADVYITGDNLSNTVSIESNGSDGLRIIGFNDPSAQPTRVNGAANGVVNIANFTGNLFVNMNGGDDDLRLTRVKLPGLAQINLGDGNDDLVAGLQDAAESRFGASAAGRLTVNGNLIVIGQDGGDYVRLQSLYVRGSTTVDTGDGGDFIQTIPGIEGNNLDQMKQSVDILGGFTIVPGTGPDVVATRGLSVGGNLVIDDSIGGFTALMNGFRVGGNAYIYGTPEVDDIEIRDARVASLFQIISEGSNDNISVFASRAGNLNINSGDGNDTVVVGVFATRADIQLGIGNDRLTLRDSAIETLFAFGNEGDDVFNVRSSSGGSVNFYGDGGTDTLQSWLAEPSFYDDLNLYSIERVRQI